MRHEGYGHQLAPVGPGGGAFGWETIVLALLIAVALATLAFLAWRLWSRRPSPIPLEHLGVTPGPDEVDAQILAMLHQAGGSLRQTTIRENLQLPLGEVAAGLQRLEEQGEVTRVWQPDEYTYVARVIG